MKKFLILVVTSLLLVHATAQDPAHLDRLGLLSELAYIKAKAEAAVSISLEKKDPKKTSDLIVAYNNLRFVIEQFVLQLSSDMAQRNSVRPFKKINNLLKEKRLMDISTGDDAWSAAYANALVSIKNHWEEFISKLSAAAVAAVADFLGPLELVETTISGMSERRASKVEKITALLEKVRLSPVKDLKGKDEEEKK